MAVYTVQLKTLIENHFDIGLKNYPIFDENYRNILNEKIINHYLFNEIGMETAELFKFYINTTMNEIMPYYNQLYKSELLEFNPLYDADLTTVYDKTNDNTSTTDSNNNSINKSKVTTKGNVENESDSFSYSDAHSTGDSHGNSVGNGDTKNVHSDTPQGFLSINSIENETYATDATMSKTKDINTTMAQSHNDEIGYANESSHSNSINNSITNGNSTLNSDNNVFSITNNFENYASHVIGKSPGMSYSDLLLRFRETFLNIDMMIIKELNECFMLLY